MMSKVKHFEQGCLATLLALVAVAFLAPASAQAGLRWCYTDHPDAVFCEDFDQYCCSEYLGCTGEGLPPSPNHTCEPIPGYGCSKDNGKAVAVWVPIQCGAVINLDEHGDCGSGDAFPLTAPFGAKYPKGTQGNHNVNLGAYANAKYGGQYNSVKGTAETPLVLEFFLNGQTSNKLHHANTFIDLALVDGVNFIDHRAPTDYIFDDDCIYAPDEVDINHPIICQQDNPPAGCPDIANAPHHGSIAVGAVANLDKVPCVTGTSDYLPTNEHLAVFDGYKWWTLPASFNGEGNFLIGPGANQIKLTLWETTMKVELNSQGMYSWCDVPRDYQGAFNKLSLGFGQACLIDLGSWTCAKTPGTDRVYQCIPGVSRSRNHYVAVGPVYDNIALYGGEGHELPTPIGACCLTNGNCLDSLNEYECETVNGGQWQEMGSTCATTVCCAEPYADADGDGDVDQVDFGLFLGRRVTRTSMTWISRTSRPAGAGRRSRRIQRATTICICNPCG